MKNLYPAAFLKKTIQKVFIKQLLLFSFLLINSYSWCQFYDSGGESVLLPWRQIKTTNFQVIFPSEFEKQAQRLANILEYIYDAESKSLNHKPKPISVIIHSHSVTSNGFVSWAPKRMELYPAPPQYGFTSDCIDLLAVHELRHVVQIDKLNQGITQIASLILGQQAIGGVTSLIPRWFFEGDAVYTETALSSSGRGRDASFEMEMKAVVTSQDKLFSYEKMLRGSYKDYVPNHYYYGYPMVTWSRNKFGTNIYDSVLNFTAQKPWLLMSFPIGLKKATGYNASKLYNECYTDLKKNWNTQVESQNLSTLNCSIKEYYTNYRYPQQVTDTSWIALKYGMNDLYQIVMLYKNGKEKKLVNLGNTFDGKISYAATSVVWNEEVPDIRWPNKSYSCIKKLDLTTNNVFFLTYQSRYFSPAISPDGKYIATVSISETNQCFLAIIDSKTATPIKKIEIEENAFLQTPCWINGTQAVAAIKISRKGTTLTLFDIDKLQSKDLIPYSSVPISTPSDTKHHILFTADYSGIRNIYAFSKTDSSVTQLTNDKYGACDPAQSTNGKKLIYAQYTSQGYNVVESEFTPKKVGDEKKDTFQYLFKKSADQEHFNFQDSVIPEKKYEVKKYNTLANTINIHSWAPFYYDYDNLSLDYKTVTPGLTVTSQDKLSNCISTAGYSYLNGQSYLIGNVTYSGLYPVFDLSVRQGGKQNIYSNEQNFTSSSPSFKFKVKTYVPFNFSRSSNVRAITPSITSEYRNDWFYYQSTKSFKKGMWYIDYGLTAYSYRTKSLRDLLPRWGIVGIAQLSHTPFENEQLGNIWYTRGKIYLPGLFSHHGLQLSIGYQKQQTAKFLYSTLLSFPRGFSSHRTTELKSFSADYVFPIAYPDWDLGPVIYLKRIRGNIFADYAQNHYPKNDETLKSIGADLTTDFYVLRFLFPINGGIRWIYIPDANKWSTEFLFQVDLTSY
jgi:hypothetical protein